MFFSSLIDGQSLFYNCYTYATNLGGWVQSVFTVELCGDCIQFLVSGWCEPTVPIIRKIAIYFFKTPSSVIGHWLGWAKGEI